MSSPTPSEALCESVLEQRCVDPTPLGNAFLRSTDGRTTSESILDRRYTTEAVLAEEHHIVDWAEDRWTSPGRAVAIAHSVGLGEMQERSAALAAGRHPLAIVVGPAGTGKTSMLRAAVDQLQADGRPIFGLAPSAAAAEVLSGETGIPTNTVDKLIAEYGKSGKFPDQRFLLAPGTTVIVDEAGMLATPKLANIAALADHFDWRIVLVGDPLQFSAVGRGGMFGHLLDVAPDHAAVAHLERVHRFAEEWEAAASSGFDKGTRPRSRTTTHTIAST